MFMARKNVKIQERIASKKGKPKRYVYTVAVPINLLEQLGWDAGTELCPSVVGNVLTFSKAE